MTRSGDLLAQRLPSIDPIDAPLSLDALAERVRASSNFRFSWQWFARAEHGRTGAEVARGTLEQLIERPDCHRFLVDSAVELPFTIESLHEHVELVQADGEFEQVLARAAADRLGAYSRILGSSTSDRALEIRALFGSLGAYRPFELTPGQVRGCAACKHHNNHLFTNWFYGVAWDWLFLLSWTERPLVWIGCLSDTD